MLFLVNLLKDQLSCTEPIFSYFLHVSELKGVGTEYLSKQCSQFLTLQNTYCNKYLSILYFDGLLDLRFGTLV